MVFVAEELLLPSGMASDSLATCARRIDRAIHAALNLLDEDLNLEAVLSANDLSDIAHLS